MSLSKCKECGNDVSNQAKTCPHCGAKVRKSRWGIVILFALIVVACVVILPIMRGRQVIEQEKAKIDRNAKSLVEDTVKEGLAEDLGVQCISTNLFEGTAGHFAGTAKLEDGRELDIDGTIEGDMVRYTHRVKQGYEYKCKYHIDQLKLIVSPEDEGRGILRGEVWNDGSEPIRGFVVAEFVDDGGRVCHRYRGTVPFPHGNKPFDWIPPGKKADFLYPASAEMLSGNVANIRLEFFNLADEPLASTGYESFDKSVLDSIPVKVTSQTYKIQKEKVNSKQWEEIQNFFAACMTRILYNTAQ